MRKKKIVISKLFLYRYRFIIGYAILGLAFTTLLFVLPVVAQYGLSQAEIDSATNSFNLSRGGILNGELVDLPYRILQKASISIFGLTAYAIKLPSIIIGLMLGFLFILLLNRWFKSNVSLLASTLITLSTPFLFLAGSGTPLIMLVFWPTLLLWLGSKIQGEKRPKPLYCFAFALIMLLSLFTPYMVYFALFCVIFVISQPHLRFVIRHLPIIPTIIIGLLLLGGFVLLGVGIHNYPNVIMDLLFTKDFNINNFFSNIATSLGPVFSWRSTVESVFLSPLISLPVFALVLIGLFSTTKGFFASRNSIATILILFSLIIAGFNPNAIIFLILPFSILIAHGFKYILEKWYGLFPENPYARVSAVLPLIILFSIMIIPNLLQYVYGYRYNPNIANQFTYTLEVINENVSSGKLLATNNYDFYKILEHKTDIIVVSSLEGNHENIASLGPLSDRGEVYRLSEIITSPMRENSDIIYLYTYTEKEGE
ncbi:glycosyltransferase family 39 protein [Candidatus Saccharibacteria bacterium]|nr:glycosyltransferase family 39 protein [Candidatus Saccharibacteria bacterium]